MSIYTKTGDNGETSLYGGKRVAKSEEILEVYGTIDEANSWIGLIAARINIYDVRSFLQTIQSDLFLIGSVLAGWHGDTAVLMTNVCSMEERIDAMDNELPRLANFVLPGGSESSGIIQIARSVVRRAERALVGYTLLSDEEKNIQLTKIETERFHMYMNRLSDFLFVLSRYINYQSHIEDVVWKRPASDKK